MMDYQDHESLARFVLLVSIVRARKPHLGEPPKVPRLDVQFLPRTPGLPFDQVLHDFRQPVHIHLPMLNPPTPLVEHSSVDDHLTVPLLASYRVHI